MLTPPHSNNKENLCLNVVVIYFWYSLSLVFILSGWCGGLANDVRDWCKFCLQCQGGKVLHLVHIRPEKFPVPFRRSAHVHVDLVGPLHSSHGFTYLFTCINRSTRWPEAIPLTGVSVAEYASSMFHRWISRFGIPAVITSDRGAQFTSSLWSTICSLLKIKQMTTTAFHPQSNDMVERFHRQFKNSLLARLASSNWFEHLPWVLLGLRTSLREDSASEAVYGSELTLPGQFLEVQDPPTNLFYENLKNSMSGFQPVSLVIILLQLTLFQKLFLQNSYLAQWFLYVRMDMLLL